jgi:membrane protein YqaA with SNARE-associated domain
MDQLYQYGYLGLFLASFLAATVLPFSSEAILGLMVANGYGLWPCILLATAGNWLGGLTGYYLGYLGNFEKLKKYLRFDKDKFEKWEVRLRKHGSPLAFLSWMPFIGDVLIIGLGLIRCNVIKVSVFMLVGKFLRYLALAYLTLKAF